MADKELDLDVSKPAGGNKKLIIIIAVVGVVLIGATAGGMYMLLGGKPAEGDHAAAAESHKAESKQELYLALSDMVVNFPAGSPARFLQVTVQLMAHDEVEIKAMEHHMPAIRNDVLVLLSSQSYEEIATREGKEKLRSAILSTVQRIVKEAGPLAEGQKAPEGPAGVYFTNFIMQ